MGPLIGRSEVLERLERELLEARLITILGPPGMGKTTVATAALQRLAAGGAYPGGTYFCDLTQARTEGELCFAVRSVVGDEGGDAAQTTLGGALADLGPALLVLDNFEQLASCAEVVEAWLRGAPELSVVVTSRERLAIAGETVLELPPLTCPDPGDGDALVSESDAVRLFVSRARAAGGDPGTDASLLAEIVRRLEGIPLAIELAAARTRLLGPAELARRLDAGLDVLGASRGATRHTTLTRAIDGSWILLSAAEQVALARCSVFAGSFTLDAAAEVAGAPLDLLGALRDKSLIHATADARLALYVSIREYAARKLLELGDDEAREARRRHARFYAATARHFNATAGLASNVVEPGVQARLRREKDNLASALRHASGDDGATSLQPDLAMAVAALYAMPAEACVEALSAALAA
ncbi:MAG TPA: AAA family ATPase, partial [Labilithrix sp.]|nr:AAA family ATPase [Labilithrix sp.]